MGVLTAVQYVPFLLFGLLAGVWVDRFRRRPILIASDLVNAVALITIPLAAVAGLLRFELLLGVAFVTGSTLVISSVAYQSFLPSLVPREHLVDANAALELGASTSITVGPGVGGFLVQILTAPIAVLADAISFLFSALCLRAIRTPEPPPIPVERRESAIRQIAEGLRLVLGNSLLRPIMACGMTHNLFARMIEALFIFYAVTTLGLDPVTLGLVLACAGPGAVVGALLSSRVPRRLGLGRTLVAGQALTGISRLLIPVAIGPAPVPAVVLGLSIFLLGVARPVFNVNQLSLRQTITPDRLQGRVNATMRFLMWGVTPIGALIGGLAASVVGVHAVLVIAGFGVLAATLPLLLSPVARLREQPPAASST